MIINKKIDFIFIKFPILFPIIFGLFLYKFPSYDNILLFLTLLLLAEPHFGATIPFFLSKENFSKIKSEKILFIFIPILIIIFSIIGFFKFYNLFLLIFLAANFYHVTRQSYGVCKLYTKKNEELLIQEFFIYFFNIIFFVIALLRFSLDLLNSHIQYLNIFMLGLITLSSIIYIYRYKFNENFFTMLTGILIFYPVCFVSKPIYAIVMGVTMHYSQYLILTYKITKNRNLVHKDSKSNLNFIIIIISYGIIMSLLSSSALINEIFKNLLLIPLIGQMLHFYIDSNLWKFSDKHHRNVTLKHLLS